MTNKYIIRARDSYHGFVYLLPPMERRAAYWGTIYRAQIFATPQAADAEATRIFGNDWRVQIAPLDDRDTPDPAPAA